MEKDLALRLLDAIEQMFIENIVMKDVLQRKGWKVMDQYLADATADPEMQAIAHKKFSEVRSHIQQSRDLSDAIQGFLQVIPANKDEN
jgi:1,2-phenylacetyl-CoA epoxidase catalytic subunit